MLEEIKLLDIDGRAKKVVAAAKMFGTPYPQVLGAFKDDEKFTERVKFWWKRARKGSNFTPPRRRS